MRRRKIERVKRAETTGFKVEQHRGTLATVMSIRTLTIFFSFILFYFS